MTPDVPLLFALTLADDGSPASDKLYIRIPPSDQTILFRFVLEPGSLAAGGQPSLSTNYPIDTEFDRHSFQSVPFVTDPRLLHANCDIELSKPGVYEYRVDYKRDGELVSSDSGYFVVEPKLPLLGSHPNATSSFLPLDALMIQSVVPKWMGPISEWDDIIAGIMYAGYNMIHFVPMQQRGPSNSPYSIANQLTFADDLFDSQDQKKSSEERLEIVKSVLKKLEDKHHILSLSDVVWNHTSDGSSFLLEHPEAGYNMHNSPHLIPAYELDSALVDLSGHMTEYDLPCKLTSEDDVKKVMNHIKTNVVPDLKLYEYKVVDVKKRVAEFRDALQARHESDPASYAEDNLVALSLKEQAARLGQDAIKDNHLGTRFHKSVDLFRALSFVLALAAIGSTDQVPGERIDELTTTFERLLNEYNLPLYEEYDTDTRMALDNIHSRMVFTRLDSHGPKLGEISKSNPLVESYFTRLEDKEGRHPTGSMHLANNGWIWGDDPMKDFAGPDSSAYLRRQVIAWGDCVKLRYGASPDDNPWLWGHMKKYTEQAASLFHAIRIDNCHSTPIHVAAYLLDAARKVRPDLYVLAELFTGSAEKDNVFVSRLGIHSLIREAMQAGDPHELSRLVHLHGGKPVGSMDEDMLWKLTPYEGDAYETVTTIPVLHGSIPRALFMDCTHDNETPSQKRTPQDALPNAAIVTFSDCATGSVKGYDELYPRLLDIVNEKRHYVPTPAKDDGILPVKHALQKLHLDMAIKGYSEVHVHQENDYLLVHRQHPGSQAGYLLIARTAFPHQGTGKSPIQLRKSKVTFVLGYTLTVEGEKEAGDDYLHGLPNHLETLPEPELVQKSDGKGEYVEVVLPASFAPGSIIVLETSIGDLYEDTHKLVTSMDDDVVKDLDLVDVNLVLYRCEGEEKDMTGGDGVYNVPNYGTLVYAGLQGFMTALKSVIENNDLGHPVCDNLRQGTWALDYVQHRLGKHLDRYPHLQALHDWFQSRFDNVKAMPDFLIPKYFALTVQTAYDKVFQHAMGQMAPIIQHGDPFLQRLAITSVQMYGAVPSTGLHPTHSGPSLAAGLPHFTNGPFRTWGRDVFISLRGLLMVTGQFEAAKEHIMSFAGSLKHGLIPNLLDSVRQPRYNARDAVWFFVQAIQDYYNMAPDGKAILQVKVPRRFPKDDKFVSVEDGYKYKSTVAEIIQEIFERHARGIHFREYHAGPDIDRQMSDAGFNIDIAVDWETGVSYGGNTSNCGTWMDKMGESEKARNKGLPGTSRDGAPIEMTGLLKSALRWVVELHNNGEYEWAGVEVDGKTITFKHWNDLLQKHFERTFYIPQNPAEDEHYDVVSSVINRRGMYKDVIKASRLYTEYQLRPNFCVAMVVAPELFDVSHAKAALQLARDSILGPLGMRTLDPSDQEYRPNYDNSNDSDDTQIAKGRNYHQGPEWLWLTGYFLRACHHFDALSPQDIARILRQHRSEITTNPWRGLPELTNKDGAPCYDSCHTQAWSSATLLELMHDLIEGPVQPSNENKTS